MYLTLKLIHIVSAIVWVGAAFTFLVMDMRAARARDHDTQRVLLDNGEAFGKTVFGPAAIVTLLAGVGMVLVGDLSFGAPWIGIGFAGIASSIVIGAVPVQRAVKELRARVAAAGFGDPGAQAVARRLTLLTQIDFAVLLVVVWAMVTKPGA